jgi:cytochrome c-type protein NapC
MSKEHPGALRRFWAFLRTPSRKYSVLALLVVGFVGGVLWWGAFNTGLEATNSLEFCISCHEMRDNTYKEYRETIHYKNRTGVRAICSDCHVPKDWTHKLVRKIQASAEVWGKITGYVDTPEKFEAHRMALATEEWARMKATGSRECRNCHSFDAMDASIQKQSVYTKHMAAQKAGQTCIDCHKGIAHHLPKEYRDPNEEE